MVVMVAVKHHCNDVIGVGGECGFNWYLAKGGGAEEKCWFCFKSR